MISFKQFVAENTDSHIPKILYHATYKPLLKSIMEFGLGGKRSKYRWEDSKKGIVYLARTADVAESYAESNDDAPESWLDSIVVLKIDTSKLDIDKFALDRNVIDNQGDTLEYKGVIPAAAIGNFREIR